MDLRVAMSRQSKDNVVVDTVEKLKRKYVENWKQLTPAKDIASGRSDEAAQQLKQISKEVKYYNKALHELFKAVTNHPQQFGSDHSLNGSNQDLSGDCLAAPFQDSQGLFTETDVTLPSCLEGSPGSPETENDGRLQRASQLPELCCSSSSVVAKVYQEMMTIYKQLKAERLSQQQWEKELQERERRLKQQEEAFQRLNGLEEMIQTGMLAVEEKHQREVSQLQDLVRERSRENRRLKSSFDTIKELNDNMKKKLNEISEQKKKLENQSKRVHARLENLQRKSEHSAASRGCVKGTECIKPLKMEKSAASGKPSIGVRPTHTHLKLLAFLMDWILDGQIFTTGAGNERKGVGPCLPPGALLSERCLKVLPLLADQLHQTAVSEPDLLLNLLRLTHWTLRHMDRSSQHVARSATLRRMGEAVSKAPTRLTVPHAEDPDLPESLSGVPGGACRSWPLSRSPCPHTRVLSTLIILRTVTQADVLAQALDSLHTELMLEESRGLFVHYEGVCVLMWMLRAGRGGLHTPTDILMQLTEPSRSLSEKALPRKDRANEQQDGYLNPFLDACSNEEFFQTASQLLKNPRLELPSLEKLSILLQKLSSIRKNRRLFELSSLHHQIQELNQKSNTHTFLCLNLRSILLNLQ